MHTNLADTCFILRILMKNVRSMKLLYTIDQYSFISFATQMARLLLELKYSILLVMYSWIDTFYSEKIG